MGVLLSTYGSRRDVEPMVGLAVRSRALGAESRGSPGSRLDISEFPTRHNYGLALWQNRNERRLANWIDELGFRSTADVR